MLPAATPSLRQGMSPSPTSVVAMPSRHRVAAVEEIAPGSGRELTVGDRIVAIYRIGDDFYAMDGICPHAGGPLGKGYVSGRRVTCPWHGWQFDVTTGVHCLTPAIRHETFPVTMEDGAVYVELP